VQYPGDPDILLAYRGEEETDQPIKQHPNPNLAAERAPETHHKRQLTYGKNNENVTGERQYPV
jgi:hypothetical protein